MIIENAVFSPMCNFGFLVINKVSISKDLDVILKFDAIDQWSFMKYIDFMHGEKECSSSHSSTGDIQCSSTIC